MLSMKTRRTPAIRFTMHQRMQFLLFFVAVVWLSSVAAPADAQVNVTQFHNHDSRDGLYIDSAFTPSAAAKLTRDLTFDGTISGNVYAQPLYIEGGPSGKAMIIVATESNNVYALDASSGASSGSETWAIRFPQTISYAPNLIPSASLARPLSTSVRVHSFWTQ